MIIEPTRDALVFDTGVPGQKKARAVYGTWTLRSFAEFAILWSVGALMSWGSDLAQSLSISYR